MERPSKQSRSDQIPAGYLPRTHYPKTDLIKVRDESNADMAAGVIIENRRNGSMAAGILLNLLQVGAIAARSTTRIKPRFPKFGV